jgi:thiol-disulfide isomerase/thioredoxin
MKRAILLTCLLALAALPTGLRAQQPLNGIEGEKAPELAVDTWIQLPKGKDRLLLSDYPDKIIVLLFFQHLCRASQERELPVLKNLVEHYKGNDGIVFIAIQTTFESYLDNTADKLPVTAKKFGLKIPFGHSPKLPRGLPSVSRSYKPGGTPWWVIIDREGKVEYNGFVLNEEEAIKGFDKMLAGLPVD